LLGSLVATGLAVKNLNDKKHPQPTDATDVNGIESGMETSGGFVGAEPATPFEITAFLASLTPSLRRLLLDTSVVLFEKNRYNPVRDSQNLIVPFDMSELTHHYGH